MAILLQIDFSYTGPFGDAMTEEMAQLAESIAKEPGLISKIWTENSETNEAGGIYFFKTEADAKAYLKKHSERLKDAGVPSINAKFFHINPTLSNLSKTPQYFLEKICD